MDQSVIMDEGLQSGTDVFMKKSICILAFSTIARDARVLRQIKYLSRSYEVTVIGYGTPHETFANSPNIKWLQINNETSSQIPNLITALRNHDYGNIRFWMRVFRTLKHFRNKALSLIGIIYLRAYEEWFWQQKQYRDALQLAVATRCHAYHANDWDMLPVAAKAAEKNHSSLVLDLHEYAPLEYENRPQWWIQKRFITYILQKYSPQVNATTTVASLIAERYRREFGLDPIVIMNAPEQLPNLSENPSNKLVKLVHHGVASSIRNPEFMIETIALCDTRYSLHFMFIKNEYVEVLKQSAERLAPGRVFFHDPVTPEDITREISQYDVGFFLIPPSNYNYLVCLPNKFFDFITAGLAVAIGPSPAMVELVNKYGFGVVSSSFKPEDMAKLLNQTSSEQWSKMRQSAINAAVHINAGTEMGKLLEIYDRILR